MFALGLARRLPALLLTTTGIHRRSIMSPRLPDTPQRAVELGYLQGRLILRVRRIGGSVSSEIVCRGDRNVTATRIGR